MLRASSILLVACGLSRCTAVINPCYEERQEAFGTFWSYVGDRKCYNLTGPVEMEGLWHREFEGSAFVEGATDPAVLKSAKRIWLNDSELLGGIRPPAEFGATYRVKFIGRKPGWSWSRIVGSGYGHLGMSDGLVVVDRFVSIEKIAQPAP